MWDRIVQTHYTLMSMEMSTQWNICMLKQWIQNTSYGYGRTIRVYSIHVFWMDIAPICTTDKKIRLSRNHMELNLNADRKLEWRLENFIEKSLIIVTMLLTFFPLVSLLTPYQMDRVKRIWYLSPMRAAKVQASQRIRAVSPEPSLLAHTSSESRGTFR